MANTRGIFLLLPFFSFTSDRATFLMLFFFALLCFCSWLVWYCVRFCSSLGKKPIHLRTLVLVLVLVLVVVCDFFFTFFSLTYLSLVTGGFP